MGMGKEYCINPFNAVCEGLKSKIRCCINEYVPAIVRYKDGGTCPFILRIIRTTDTALATYYRHTC